MRNEKLLFALSISDQQYSASGFARRSKGGGGSMGYRFFRRSQISFSFIIVFVCSGLWDCGCVGLWVCGFVCVGVCMIV